MAERIEFKKEKTKSETTAYKIGRFIGGLIILLGVLSLAVVVICLCIFIVWSITKLFY